MSDRKVFVEERACSFLSRTSFIGLHRGDTLLSCFSSGSLTGCQSAELIEAACAVLLSEQVGIRRAVCRCCDCTVRSKESRRREQAGMLTVFLLEMWSGGKKQAHRLA